jgi:hypothetical protein
MGAVIMIVRVAVTVVMNMARVMKESKAMPLVMVMHVKTFLTL